MVNASNAQHKQPSNKDIEAELDKLALFFFDLFQKAKANNQ